MVKSVSTNSSAAADPDELTQMGRKQVVPHKPDHERGNDLFGLEFPQRLKEKTPANGFEPKDGKEKTHEDGQGRVVCLLKALPELSPFDSP